MSRTIDIRSQAGVLGDHEIPPGFQSGQVLAEYVRQTYHLFSGDAGQRDVARTPAQSLVLWCLRDTARFKTMQCAVFPAENEPAVRRELKAILRNKAPDAATIRVMCRDTGAALPPRLQMTGGYLLFSLGRDLSVEFLPLGENFEEFLASLGRNTRSHARSSLRTFEREGYGYRFETPVQFEATPDIRLLSTYNMPNAPPSGRLELFTDYINQQKRPFQSSLSAPNGETISIIRGYLIDDHANLVDQINRQDYPKVGQTGPSLLHRTLLIRALIGKGMRGLIVAGGCGGMLNRYCRPAVFDSYLALSPNPLSWLRCLRYFTGNKDMGIWAIRSFLGLGP